MPPVWAVTSGVSRRWSPSSRCRRACRRSCRSRGGRASCRCTPVVPASAAGPVGRVGALRLADRLPSARHRRRRCPRQASPCWLLCADAQPEPEPRRGHTTRLILRDGAPDGQANQLRHSLTGIERRGRRRSDREADRVDADVERRARGEAGIGRHQVLDRIDFGRVHRSDVDAVERRALVDDLLERRPRSTR